jgi:hypothetical protein
MKESEIVEGLRVKAISKTIAPGFWSEFKRKFPDGMGVIGGWTEYQGHRCVRVDFAKGNNGWLFMPEDLIALDKNSQMFEDYKGGQDG